MKLANEIIDALIVENPEIPFLCDTDTDGNILIPPEYLKSVIAAKLEPVKEALDGLIETCESGDVREFGERPDKAAIRLAQAALSMLSEEKHETSE